MDNGTTTDDRQAETDDQFRVDTPQVALPKGGGAISGIGEKFAANPVTGTGSVTIPIAASPGRAGFGPKLTLSYDSGSGNGPFGFGWHLPLPAITRKTNKGLPRYLDSEESDIFILSGTEDLVPVLQDVAGRWQREFEERTLDGELYRVEKYRPRIEGLFARIERWINVSDPANTCWRSISRDNVTTWYGRIGNSRIADPVDPTHIFSWLICETYDDKGNITKYQYKEEDSAGIDLSLAHEHNRSEASRSAQRHLKRVQYGNRTPYFADLSTPTALPEEWLFELVFDYGDHGVELPTPEDGNPWPVRPDPFSNYRAGFEVRTYRLCRRVLMFHRFSELGEAPCLVRSTAFTYSYDEPPENARNPVFSFMHSVTHSGYRRQADDSYLSKAMPPLEFEYSKPIVQNIVQDLDSESLENLPIGLDGSSYQWVDLDGEGLSGILREQGGDWLYKSNLGPAESPTETGAMATARFGPARRIAREPSLATIDSGRSRFMDLAGDGRLDLVELEGPTAGFYQRTADDNWEQHKAFESSPTLDWTDPNLKLIDLTGDGKADILITEQDAFCWYASIGEAGFLPSERVSKVLDEEKGPALVFADRTQSIHVADLSGDGLVDLVRIRNGEICYWPNLGYGRFGARVTMDNAPRFDQPDRFDQQQIRLADIDGSGATDIIYLHTDAVHLYFNQSGNSWSAVQVLTTSPPVDDLSSVQVADLIGNGTACLVWSSPLPGDARRPLRYIDLMGGQKPHLLVSSVNNLGTESVIHYVPSTHFYLVDKLAGKPWITRLPFPVHVVERVETFDRISGNRFVTRYAYHHGYFDGTEREFRGFGMVEQWDTEEIKALNGDGNVAEATNFDAASNVPPAYSKTWFHTGAYLGRNRVSDFFAGLLNDKDTGEYYRKPGVTDAESRTLLLEDTVLPPGLTLDEEREACRALKGTTLRQEIYALDGTDKEPHPYSVTEQNVSILRIQPRADNPHAVFFTHAREAISYHYERNERNPEDPRIGHALTLEVDGFGNPIKTVAIAYGRQQSDPALPSEDQQQQAQLHATLTENDFTHPIAQDDAYRTPLPCESRTYELTGLTQSTAGQSIPFDDCLAAAIVATPLHYEQTPTESQREKRLIEQVRTLYRPDDFGASQGDPLTLLPLGQVESLALPGENYKLALTPGLVSEIFDSKVTDQMLASEGRYVHSEGDDAWWILSGRMFFSPDSDDSPADELTYAREHFFLPPRFRDPFHTEQVPTEGFVSYDHYDLLVLETRDALDNRVTVGERDDAGNLTTNGNDYRVLQPALVMDPNRNCSTVAFDVLGMVVGTAVMGKPEENLGDTLDGFQPDLSDDNIIDHLERPFDDPHSILLGATTRLVYDLFAYLRTQDDPQPQPAVVYSLARETHVSELGNGELTRIQHSFSYSDGFGRDIQKKIQAEPGPLKPGEPDIDPRWIGSGWTVFNNKGKPVRQYEPFFSATHAYESASDEGVSPILFYDPVGRIVATLHPNHAWEKVVFDPWRQETWDVNDTILVANPADNSDVGDFFRRLSEDDYLPTWHAQRIDGALGLHEQAAATKTAVHRDTPAVAHMDSLGRTFLSIAHNKLKRRDSPEAEPPEEAFQHTRVVFDIEGNQREVIDALDRIVMRYDYDMLGNQIHSASMEAGERWILNDVAGQPIRAWDNRGHLFRTGYDRLHRPLHQFVIGSDAAESDPRVFGREVLFGKIEYGEGQADDTALNLRTRAWKAYDSAGVVTSEAYDFKGNPLRGNRQLASDYKKVPDWSTTVILDDETFASSTSFDALNRPVTSTSPDGSVIRPAYNEANLLECIDINLRGEMFNDGPVWTPFVTDINYNAKGQRERISYGNGVSTEYSYDPLTFRLLRLFTQRDATGFPDDCPASPLADWPGCAVQNLHYTYDAIGNITHIQDDAQQTIYFRNQRVEPSNDYLYDATYQLIEASGREHLGQLAAPTAPDAFNSFHTGLEQPGDGNAMGSYLERYVYDAVGNFLEMQHHGTDPAHPGWTRSYAYEELSLTAPGKVSNRLSSTTVGNTTESYSYNAHGSMTRMPHLPLMQWTFLDQLQASSKQVVNEGTPETSYYVYDAAGQRVRKVTERQAIAGETATLKNERVYLGGFEVYREYGGDGVEITLEREALHVMDDKQRISLVETRTSGDDGSAAQLIRYQFGNHLGSASLELDEVGQTISFEEYLPYGSTSYQALDAGIKATAKRYRYTGMELDGETGLALHGVRYCASWLGRWCSADPIGIADGPNRYQFVRGNPINGIDPSGLGTKWSDENGIDSQGNTVRLTEGSAGGYADIEIEVYLGPTIEAEPYPDLVRWLFRNPPPKAMPGVFDGGGADNPNTARTMEWEAKYQDFLEYKYGIEPEAPVLYFLGIEIGIGLPNLRWLIPAAEAAPFSDAEWQGVQWSSKEVRDASYKLRGIKGFERRNEVSVRTIAEAEQILYYHVLQEGSRQFRPMPKDTTFTSIREARFLTESLGVTTYHWDIFLNQATGELAGHEGTPHSRSPHLQWEQANTSGSRTRVYIVELSLSNAPVKPMEYQGPAWPPEAWGDYFSRLHGSPYSYGTKARELEMLHSGNLPSPPRIPLRRPTRTPRR